MRLALQSVELVSLAPALWLAQTWFALRPNPPGTGGRSGDPGLDRNRFKEFYAELDARDPPANPETVVCVGPVAYTGQAQLARDIPG